MKEPAETVAAFVDAMGLTFPVALDPDGQISDKAYQVRGIPTTLFVDANGTVAARHVGPLDGATIKSYLTPLLEQGRTPLDTQDDDPLAPDFTLDVAAGAPVSLQDYRGKQNRCTGFSPGEHLRQLPHADRESAKPVPRFSTAQRRSHSRSRARPGRRAARRTGDGDHLPNPGRPGPYRDRGLRSLQSIKGWYCHTIDLHYR